MYREAPKRSVTIVVNVVYVDRLYGPVAEFLATERRCEVRTEFIYVT
jgi:hypothetical protein